MSETPNPALSKEDQFELEDLHRSLDYIMDHISDREFNIYQSLELKFELNKMMTLCVEQNCKTIID